VDAAHSRKDSVLQVLMPMPKCKSGKRISCMPGTLPRRQQQWKLPKWKLQGGVEQIMLNAKPQPDKSASAVRFSRERFPSFRCLLLDANASPFSLEALKDAAQFSNLRVV